MISPYLIPGALRSIDDIVADSFDISPTHLSVKSRKRELIEARHFAMWYRFLYTPDGPCKIGRMYNRSHCSVYHACNNVNNLLETNKAFRKKAEYTMLRLKEAGHGKN